MPENMALCLKDSGLLWQVQIASLESGSPSSLTVLTMTIIVNINADTRSSQRLRFEDVEGFSFYSGRNNSTGKAVAQWTKFIDDNPSQEWVNLNPSILTIDSVDLFDGALHAYARLVLETESIQAAKEAVEYSRTPFAKDIARERK